MALFKFGSGSSVISKLPINGVKNRRGVIHTNYGNCWFIVKFPANDAERALGIREVLRFHKPNEFETQS